MNDKEKIILLDVHLPLIIPMDVMMQFLGEKRFLVYNLFTRNNVICTIDVVKLCQELLVENNLSQVINRHGSQRFCVWDSEYFSNEDGLLADPTRVRWNECVRNDPQIMDISRIIALLINKNILLQDEKVYRARFSVKKGLFDNRNFGNFHQQLGSHLLLSKREDPAKWWVQQKFTDDHSDLKNNLYKAVQGQFLKKYFQKTIRPGMRIVDIGCGVGYYSNMMASLGAEVIGIDPNEKYIDIARRKMKGKIEFHVAPLGRERCLDILKPNSADVVFISDSLLFYFVSYDAAPKPSLGLLFKEISRILRPSGKLWSMEPNYTFWVSPWFGENDHPFTVLTEYRKRSFLVTPTISEFVQSIIKESFVVSDLKEIYIDDAHDIKDKKAVGFSSEFPLWQFIEFLPFATHHD